MSDKSIPFPSPSLFLRSVLFKVYAPAEVTMFLSADISRNRLGASLQRFEPYAVIYILLFLSASLCFPDHLKTQAISLLAMLVYQVKDPILATTGLHDVQMRSIFILEPGVGGF